MAKQSMTGKPCPGCGRDEGGYTFRPANGVCDTCRGRLASAIAEEKRQGAVGVLKSFELPFAPHIFCSPLYAEDAGKAVSEDMFAILYALAYPCYTFHGGYGYYRERYERMHARGLLPSGLHDLMMSLRDNIKAATVTAYKQGQANGANTLRRLVDGEITIADLERTT